MKYSEWLDEAKRLYRDNAGNWKFKCPSCGTHQTAKDFVEAGLSKENASASIANECIGRHLNESECDYAGYGLVQLSPVEIEMEDGRKHHAFAFADGC